jgi:cation diffusion facilitator CzcD-associated flavoprotein CzcO
MAEDGGGAATDFDVLIVGAGVSGIGSAVHLRTQRPGTSFALLEMKETFGGTWVTHRYPGARSDTDLYTYGYRFKPWTGAPLATAGESRSYLAEVIAEHDLARVEAQRRHARRQFRLSGQHRAMACRPCGSAAKAEQADDQLSAARLCPGSARRTGCQP